MKRSSSLGAFLLLLLSLLGLSVPSAAQIEVAAEEREAYFAGLEVPELSVKRHLLTTQELVLWLPETWAQEPNPSPNEAFFADPAARLRLRAAHLDFSPGSSILQTVETALEILRKREKAFELRSVRRLRVSTRPAVEVSATTGEGEELRQLRLVWITDPVQTSFRIFEIEAPGQEVDLHLRRLLRDFSPLEAGVWNSAFERTRKSLGAVESGLALDRRNRLFAEIAEPDALDQPGIAETLQVLARAEGATLLIDGVLHLHPRVRIAAIEALDLRTLADPARARFLAAALLDPDPAVRSRHARKLAAVPAPALAQETLARIFDTDHDEARSAAFQLLAALPPESRVVLLQQTLTRISELPVRSQVLWVHLLELWTPPEIAEAALLQVAKRSREARLQALALARLLERGHQETLGLARERLLRPLENKPLDLVVAARALAIHTPFEERESLVPLRDALVKAPPAEKPDPKAPLDQGKRLLEAALQYLGDLPANAAKAEECAALGKKKAAGPEKDPKKDPKKQTKPKPDAAAENTADEPATDGVAEKSNLPDWKAARRERLGCPKETSPELATLHLSRPGGVLASLFDRLQELQVGSSQHNAVYHTILAHLGEKLETWQGDPFSVASTGLDLSAPLEVAWWASGYGGDDVSTRMTLRAGDAERLQESMLRLSTDTTGFAGMGGGLLVVQALPLMPLVLFDPWGEERALREGENEDETAPSDSAVEKPQRHLALVQEKPAAETADAAWTLVELAIDAKDQAVWTHTTIGRKEDHLVFQAGDDPVDPAVATRRVLADDGPERLSSRIDVDLTQTLRFAAQMGGVSGEATDEGTIPDGLWLRARSDLDSADLATRLELEGLAEEYLAATVATRADALRAPRELLPKNCLAWLGFSFAPVPIQTQLKKHTEALRKEMGAKNLERLLQAAALAKGEAGMALVGVAEPEGPSGSEAWKRRLVLYLAVDPVAADRYLAKHWPRTEKIGQLKAHRIGKVLAARFGELLVLAADPEILKSLGKPPFLVDSEAHREILGRTPEEATLRGFFDTDLLADALVGYQQARREEGMSGLLVEFLRALGRVGLYVRREEGRLVGEISIAPRRQSEEALERSRELATYASFTSGSVPTRNFPRQEREEDFVELELELHLPKGLKDPKLDWSNERLQHKQVEPGLYHLHSRPSLTLPETSAVRLPIRAPELLPYLRNEDQLDLHLDAVRKQAEKIRGKEEDPARIVRAIVEWAHLSLEYSVIRKSPRVEEILKTRKADCTEFTQLTIALARSLGIPARPVGGIHVGPDGAILHRWAEVYLDRWYEIDSTFGVVEVPATSLRLPSDDGTLLASVPGSRFVFLRGKKGDGSEVLPEPPPASSE